MANIESKLTTIKSASGGEDVRDAIIGALRDINNDVPADMSNPEHIVIDMPAGSDKTVPFNPPKLVSEIYVKQPNTGGKSMTTPDITITENGEYPADDPSYDPDEEIRYYSKVTVKVPQLANAVLDLEEEITQNGTYSAPADWGVDGIRTFTVNVSGASGDGPFKVEFYDKPLGDTSGVVIETQIVALNGSAHCTKLDGTTLGGKNFKGWNPSPNAVTRDTKCYPVYGEWKIDPNETDDDWSVICADRGASYPIGTAKNMVLVVTANTDQLLAKVKRVFAGDWNDLRDTEYHTQYNNQIVFNFPYLMVKVAEGEDGTGSTWISSGCANVPWISNNDGFIATGDGGIYQENTFQFLKYYRAPYGNWSYGHMNDWEGSTLRQLLNGIVFDALDPALKSGIKSVNKHSMGLTTQTPSATRVQKTTLDKIWVPSAKELHSLLSLSTGVYDWTYPTTLSEIEEFNGVDYTANYGFVWPTGVKTAGLGFLTRTGIYSNAEKTVSSMLYSRWFEDTPENTMKLCSEDHRIDVSDENCCYFPFGFCL